MIPGKAASNSSSALRNLSPTLVCITSFPSRFAASVTSCISRSQSGALAGAWPAGAGALAGAGAADGAHAATPTAAAVRPLTVRNARRETPSINSRPEDAWLLCSIMPTSSNSNSLYTTHLPMLLQSLPYLFGCPHQHLRLMPRARPVHRHQPDRRQLRFPRRPRTRYRGSETGCRWDRRRGR